MPKDFNLSKICFILHNIIFLSNTVLKIFFKPFEIRFANTQRYFILQTEKRNTHDIYI